ncbi:pectate lyase 8 [Spatholobus suberectus]|nr:pectate lyase 8 [Spatholobus suberectus]
MVANDMTITLKHNLILNSFRTMDGHDADVHVTSHNCITFQYISNVIIHNIHMHHCTPFGNTNIHTSPMHVGWRGKSDGCGISIFGSWKIWIDH